MIVDTSAIIAVLKREAERDAILTLLESTVDLRMSAVNRLETCQIVDGGRIGVASSALDALFAELGITIEAFTSNHAAIARAAFNTYGKGMGAWAGLNICDCCAYALAKATGEPLLFVGDDFSHTDLVPALMS
ncbi:MAG: type II toxin-antitoxin system VapC family toxin [Thermomicrobiales bacterium]